jgi:thermitase
MRTRLSHALLALLLASGAAPALAEVVMRSTPDEVLVAFRPGTPSAEKRAAHAQVHGHASGSVAQIGVTVVSVPAGTTTAALQVYRRNPNVLYAEPNYIRPLVLPTEGAFPGVPNIFDEQWNLHNTGAGIDSYADPDTGAQVYPMTRADADIDAPEAWDVSQGSPDVWVAVADSGVACHHGDLVGKCVHEEDHVTPTVDSYGTPIPELVDRIGHGTHVAGTIAMATDNGDGAAGVGWNVSVGSFKVCYAEVVLGLVLGSNCEDADIASAIVAIADYGYHVVNMSFGGGPSAVVQSAVEYAASQGVVLVAAAGNHGNWERFYPAAYPDVLSVAATTPFDDRAQFSAFSIDDDQDPSTSDDDWVDVLAPGSPILSAAPPEMCANAEPQCFQYMEGTSMASPHASGVAGLVWSHLLATDPANADRVEVRRRIQDCADARGAMGQDMRVWSRYGRLNAHGALTCGGSPPPPPPPPGGDPIPPVHVADLDGAGMSPSGPSWDAQVTVTVHDAAGAPVEDAQVSGGWSAGSGSGSSSCTTDASGQCAVTWTGIRKKTASVSYTVSGVGPLAYDAGANQDADGDSDGTTVAVGKP